MARKLDKCAQDAFDAVRKHSQVSDQTHPILESRALTNTQAELHTVLQERGLPALFERYATEEQSDELAPGECEEMWEAREKAKVCVCACKGGVQFTRVVRGRGSFCVNCRSA